MKTLEKLHEEFERKRSNPDKRDAAEKALTGEVPVSPNNPKKDDPYEIDENLKDIESNRDGIDDTEPSKPAK